MRGRIAVYIIMLIIITSILQPVNLNVNKSLANCLVVSFPDPMCTCPEEGLVVSFPDPMCTCPEEGLVTFEQCLGCADSACLENG